MNPSTKYKNNYVLNSQNSVLQVTLPVSTREILHLCMDCLALCDESLMAMAWIATELGLATFTNTQRKQELPIMYFYSYYWSSFNLETITRTHT